MQLRERKSPKAITKKESEAERERRLRRKFAREYPFADMTRREVEQYPWADLEFE